MGILQKFVNVKITNFNIEYYKTIYCNIKPEDIIYIPVNFLSKGSGIKLQVQCDYCNKIFYKEYRRIINNDICCLQCRYKKVEKTNLEKYGVKCSLRNIFIQQKTKQTCLKKFGVETPLQSNEIRKKCTNTMIEKYGQPYTLQIPELKKKTQINISKPQKYLQELYGGILNFPIGKYNIDIYISQYNIGIEYDGGGHQLSVIFGHCSEKEFQQKEQDRINFLLENNIKVFKIISNNDKLPSTHFLLQLKKEVFNYFLNYNYKYYSFNCDTQEKIIF